MALLPHGVRAQMPPLLLPHREYKVMMCSGLGWELSTLQMLNSLDSLQNWRVPY